MKEKKKMALALAACAAHEETYGTKVPLRLRELWQSGEAFRAHGRCLPPGTSLPGFEVGSFRLASVPPSWDYLGSMGGLDDAISGEGGEWKDAGSFLPIFLLEQSRLLVADLEDPSFPVGYYEDATFRSKANGWDRGVYRIAPSLEAFLATLVTLDHAADFETELDDGPWEDAAEETDD